ncbi:KGGVGR-motif variant AAA ATPase [Hugenholtzia roseola]|uniref:KGGVGR-motif variant AAA ATPase n=1 Tax=Hugenholtzia roseola TaxID=1002 RepID=UPI000684293D|nr:tetratricopeptide repeat protein [Hugenholtzia roseola]
MFVSFYSYKGGVGRTQLLVNAASYLCFYKHKKILMLEWDLEAPGLHYYFGKKNTDIAQEGLIEILEKYMSLAHRGSKLQKEELPFFTEQNIVKDLIVSKNGQGKVDLIPCANYSQEGFNQKINDFDWKEFTEMRDGNVFIDFLKTKLKEFKYDYVFIDSRTGIADYSGLCNILLPDVNVIVIAPTYQNFEGSLKIAKAISEHPYLKEGNRKPFILPILSRIDNSAENYEKWIEDFETDFGFVCEVLLDDKLKAFKTQVFRDLYVPQTALLYNRKVALGENLLFDREARPKNELSLAKNYENIANYIDRLNQAPHLDFYGEISQELLERWLSENQTVTHYIDILDIYVEMGNLQKAKETAEKGLLMAQKEDDKYHEGLFYQRLGDIESSFGNLEQALQFFEKCNNLMKELYEAYPSNANFKNGLAISYEKLGETQASLGNLGQALEFFEKDMELSKELYESYPSNVDYKNGLATSYSKLGETQASLGNLEQALQFFEKRYQLSKELSASYPSNVGFKNGLAISYERLGSTQASLGNLERALEFFEKQYQLSKELSDSYPSNVGFKNGLANSYGQLGGVYTSLGNLEKALEIYLQTNTLFKELSASYPSNVGFKNGLALSYQFLGITKSSLGNLNEALQFFEKYNQLGKELHQDFPNNVEFKNLLAASYLGLGQTQEKLKDIANAKKYYLQGQKLYQELVRDFPKNGFQNNLQWVENQIASLE